jgi:hypothetical protein
MAGALRLSRSADVRTGGVYNPVLPVRSPPQEARADAGAVPSAEGGGGGGGAAATDNRLDKRDRGGLSIPLESFSLRQDLSWIYLGLFFRCYGVEPCFAFLL